MSNDNQNERKFSEDELNQNDYQQLEQKFIKRSEVKDLIAKEKPKLTSTKVILFMFFLFILPTVVTFFYIYDKESQMMNQTIDSMSQELSYLINTVDTINQTVIEYNDTFNTMKEEINSLTKQITTMSQEMNSFTNTINSKIQTINELNEKINSMEHIINSISNLTSKNIENLDNVIIAGRSLTGPGLLNELKKREKNEFNHLFIPTISSRNPYDMIDPNSESVFGTSGDSSKKYFIEFTLENPVTINGIKIQAATKRFPKSFDIEIDGKVVFSIKEAIQLNGINKEIKINVRPVMASKIRFVQTGPNWDENNYYLYIKRFELLSPDDDYKDGVFQTLINKNKNPQKSGIMIKTTLFDLNSFHLLNSTSNVDTFNLKDQWFQIEFTSGKVVLDGFRLKKFGRHKLKNYKIVCSDDDSKPLSDWTTLMEINEQKYHENKELDVYEFPKSSPPVKFVRLIQTGPTWSNSNYLSFYHFDLFGKYY